LDDRAIEVRQRQKDFSSSFCVQTCCGFHPASYSMGTEVISLELKHGRGVTLTILSI
jgi:hypothetical protein